MNDKKSDKYKAFGILRHGHKEIRAKAVMDKERSFMIVNFSQ